MPKFSANIDIIGINPFVPLPYEVLAEIFTQAGKDKGPIPVQGLINNKAYKQTLVKFRGSWRLYINTIMLKDSPKRVGEEIEISIEYDPEDRKIAPHPKLVKALDENKKAGLVFKNLRPSLQHEIIRYISYLKSEESIDRNVNRAITFLLGKGRFVGRDRP